jgi:hypothetical protein
LLDRCQQFSYSGLDDLVSAVAASQGIGVPDWQRDQVLDAIVAASPISHSSPRNRSEATKQTTGSHARLSELLESAWMHLAAEASAQIEAADAELAFETRYQRLTLPGWCFLLLHDAVTGRPILPERSIGAVVAAAVLAELILAGRLDVDEPDLHLRAYTDAEFREAERVVNLISRLPEGADDGILRRRASWLPPVRNRLPEISVAATRVLTQFRTTSRAMRLDAWFRRLLPESAGAVRDELAESGVVRAQRVRRGLRERTFYPPTDSFEVTLLRGSIIGPLTRSGSPPQAAPLALALELARSSGLTRARPDDWIGIKAHPTRAHVTPVHFRPAFTRLLDLVEEAADAAVYGPN